MAQRGPCGRRAGDPAVAAPQPSPHMAVAPATLCHPPLARTGPYALPYPYVYVTYRRNAPSPRPQSRRAATPQRHSRTHPNVIPAQAGIHGGGRSAGPGWGGPRHENNQRCKATPKLPGGLHQQTINLFPLFQVQNPQKTLQTIHRRKPIKPAPPPRLQLRLMAGETGPGRPWPPTSP